MKPSLLSAVCLMAGLLISPLLDSPLHAQEFKMKWGDVPIEDLRMTDFPADTNAQAVVLGELGEVEVDKRGDITYKYHVRVKLLSESAYDDWATVVIRYYDGQYPQRISKVQGNTLVLDQKGKVVRHKLGKKDVFKEDVGENIKRIKFTLPALEPGAVIEYRYTMTTEDPRYLPNWDFQHTEPTLWSEYRATLSQYYGYVQVHSVPYFTVEEEEDILHPEGKSVQYRWAIKDMPALREEPYITTLEDYKAKIEFQLAKYVVPGYPPQDYLSTWEELADGLREDSRFGDVLKPTKRVRALAEELTAGITDSHEKLKAIHNYVRTSVAWDRWYGFLADDGPEKVIKNGSGSNAEQTMLLIALLRSVDIEAYPVLLSTRENGAVKRLYPLLPQFDYVITYANVRGKDYYLDSTDPLAPTDVLPLRTLNGTGWLIGESSDSWVSIKPSSKYVRLVRVEGSLDEFGTLQGTLTASSDGYGALDLRSEMGEFSDSELVSEEILNELDGMVLSGIQIENKDNIEDPISVTADIKLDGFAQQAGDFLYVNPHALSREEENPLRLEERSFPVDLGYPYDFVYSVQMTLPEGYEVQEMPADMRLVLPEKGGLFQRSMTMNGNQLNLQTRFVLSKAKYSPKMYRNLRELYDRVVAASAEQMVLKRVSE